MFATQFSFHVFLALHQLSSYLSIHHPAGFIQREPGRRSATFHMKASDARLNVPPLQSIRGVSMMRCVMACLQDVQCNTINYHSDRICDTLHHTEGSYRYNQPGWSHYAPVNTGVPEGVSSTKRFHVHHQNEHNLVELPCQTNYESFKSEHDEEIYGDKFTKENINKLCEGNWTLIAKMDSSSDQNVHIDNLITRDISNMHQLIVDNFALSTDGLKHMRRKYKFTQVRWTCESAGKIIDIATKNNRVGNLVLKYAIEETDTPPASCGGYDVGSRDNSKMSKNCHMWLFELFFPDKDSAPQKVLYHTPFKFFMGEKYSFTSSQKNGCDKAKNRPGTWKVYIR